MIQLMQATLIATQSVSVNMLVSENCIEYFCLLSRVYALIIHYEITNQY